MSWMWSTNLCHFQLFALLSKCWWSVQGYNETTSYWWTGRLLLLLSAVIYRPISPEINPGWARSPKGLTDRTCRDCWHNFYRPFLSPNKWCQSNEGMQWLFEYKMYNGIFTLGHIPVRHDSIIIHAYDVPIELFLPFHFYLLYLLSNSGDRNDRMLTSHSMFVNNMFSKENQVLIKSLYELKGYNA